MVNENNTSKLANLWETKISGSEEKGVRKSQGVDVPDEPVKSYAKAPSTDSSPVTVLKSQSKTLPPTSLKSEAVENRSDSNTRGIVERFEKRSNENIHEKPLAPLTPITTVLSNSGSGTTPLGTGLRPITSNESSNLNRRQSAASLSRRGSSLSGLTATEEVAQKMEALALRVAQLERQVNHLETKLEVVCSKSTDEN